MKSKKTFVPHVSPPFLSLLAALVLVSRQQHCLKKKRKEISKKRSFGSSFPLSPSISLTFFINEANQASAARFPALSRHVLSSSSNLKKSGEG